MKQSKETRDRRNLALVIHHIVNHPDCIPLLKNKWRTDDVYIACLEEEPSIFQFIPHPTLKVIKTALQLDGENIKYVKKKARKDLPPEFYLIAVDSNPRGSLPYIPKKYVPTELRERVFEKDPSLIIDNDLKIIENDFIKAQIEEDPARIKFVKDPSNELKCIALRKNPNVALYYDYLTDEMMDIIDELYPSLKDSLPNYRR